MCQRDRRPVSRCITGKSESSRIKALENKTQQKNHSTRHQGIILAHEVLSVLGANKNRECCFCGCFKSLHSLFSLLVLNSKERT